MAYQGAWLTSPPAGVSAGPLEATTIAWDDDPRDPPVLRRATEVESEQKLELRLVSAVRGLEECDETPSSTAHVVHAAICQSADIVVIGRGVAR